MPDFSDPFVGNTPERKLTKQELIRAIRLDIAAEHEAICLYMAHADATDDKLVKKALVDIADEEREHLGEFERLLQLLTTDEADFREDGREEVREMEEELDEVEPWVALRGPPARADRRESKGSGWVAGRSANRHELPEQQMEREE